MSMANLTGKLAGKVLEALAQWREALRRSSLGRFVARLGERAQPHWRKLRTRYERLERREKLLVQAAGAVVGALVLYNFIYLPIANLKEELDDQIAGRQREIGEVRKLTETALRLKEELLLAEKHTVPSSKDFSLFSVLEDTLTKTVGREKIASITPADKKVTGGLVQYNVDLKLSNLTLEQLVKMLYQIKSLRVPVVVSNMMIKKRFQDPHSFDVDLTCSALGKA